MKLPKSKEVLLMANEKVEEAKAPFRSREMHKKAELELCRLESVIADREQRINDLSSEYPINFDGMLDALDDLELTKRSKEQFELIINVMFGDLQ